MKYKLYDFSLQIICTIFWLCFEDSVFFLLVVVVILFCILSLWLEYLCMEMCVKLFKLIKFIPEFLAIFALLVMTVIYRLLFRHLDVLRFIDFVEYMGIHTEIGPKAHQCFNKYVLIDRIFGFCGFCHPRV